MPGAKQSDAGSSAGQPDPAVTYLNNAATTWPKPEPVYDATDAALRGFGTPGRSATPGAEGLGAGLGGDDFASARAAVARFLNAPDPEHLVLLPGCTYALNLAILGLPWEADDVAIMSGIEHHAVSRPIRKLARERGIRFEVSPYQVGTPVDVGFIERTLQQGGVRLVCCTMASNVTGDLTPIDEVVALAHKYDALVLVDAAQAAGVLPIDIEALGPDFMGFAGHKGLFGPTGVGGLWVRPGLRLNTLAEGGTGGDSGRHELTGSFPSTFEVGTHNLPAIIGLAAGVRWLEQTGIETVRRHECELTGRLIDGLSSVPGVTVYGTREPDRRTSAVSMTKEGWAPKALADRMASETGTICRAGFHCAPLAHETIGTLKGGGTLRLSPGYFNTPEQIDAVVAWMREVD